MRKLVIWLLLIPLPLNGLWMVCRDAPEVQDQAHSSGSQATGASEKAARENCEKICALRLAEASGVVCFLSAGRSNSISIVVFGIPVLPRQAALEPPATASQSVATAADFFPNPQLSIPTPPPRV